VRFARTQDPRLRFWEFFYPRISLPFRSFCAHKLMTLISHDFLENYESVFSESGTTQAALDQIDQHL